MGNFIELTGQRFGKLTAIKRAENTKHNKAQFLCRCDCGNEKIILSASLLSGATKSCGCIQREILKSRIIDLAGQRFGKLTVLQRSEQTKSGKIFWTCKCDCGVKKAVNAYDLTSGRTKSCGCLQREKSTTHGKINTRLYGVWHSMCERCNNPNHKSYKNYGGRGIKICEEWRNDFKAFYDWALSNGYKEEVLSNGINKWTIERIDVNGNYEPDNCCWATTKAQNNNKRNNHLVTYNGERLTVSELAQKINMDYNLFFSRLNKPNWNIEKTITTKPKTKRVYEFNGETLTVAQFARKYNISPKTLLFRLNKGMCIKEAIETPINVAVRYEYNGKDYTVAEISKLYGIDERSFRSRMLKGMTVAEAIEKPIKGRK